VLLAFPFVRVPFSKNANAHGVPVPEIENETDVPVLGNGTPK
jgi:hypothetical protein